MEGKSLPISEIFLSVQGEGMFVGCPMLFVRLAGCCVGKPLTAEEREKANKESPNFSPTGSLPIYTERCTDHANNSFLCDTDFRVKERLSVGDIVSRVPRNIHHVCITGGEPLIHDLIPLAGALYYKDPSVMIHIETSGTKVNDIFFHMRPEAWITVCPKAGWTREAIFRADEIKFLVGDNFDIGAARRVLAETRGSVRKKQIFVQPVNSEFSISNEHLTRCVEIVHQNPEWRVSVQLHKLLNVR